jgi:hypothetical protein
MFEQQGIPCRHDDCLQFGGLHGDCFSRCGIADKAVEQVDGQGQGSLIDVEPW